MTPEEFEVIEAAKAWAADMGEFAVTRGLPLARESRRLIAAVDALPKPAPSLVERIRSHGDDARHRGCSAEAALLREAADELERLGAK